MTVAVAIVQLLASIMAYVLARSLDAILGKWVAYVTIAWEHVASKAAMDQFQQTRNEMAAAMSEKWKEWDAWRNGLAK